MQRLHYRFSALSLSTFDTSCPPYCSGCDLNAVDNYGDCALKKASFSGHADFVKALLAAGADPNICDGFMKSPLLVVYAITH